MIHFTYILSQTTFLPTQLIIQISHSASLLCYPYVQMRHLATKVGQSASLVLHLYITLYQPWLQILHLAIRMSQDTWTLAYPYILVTQQWSLVTQKHILMAHQWSQMTHQWCITVSTHSPKKQPSISNKPRFFLKNQRRGAIWVTSIQSWMQNWRK